MIRSIRWSLFIPYAVILALVIGSFGTLMYRDREHSMHEQIDTKLRSHAQAIASSIEWEPGEGFEFEQTERYTRQVHIGGRGPFFLVWSSAGQLLVRSDHAEDLDEPPPPGFSDRGSRREFMLLGPHQTVVLVSHSTSKARAELLGFRLTLFKWGGGVYLFSLLCGWLLMSWVLAPIRRMTRTAERITETRTERIDIGQTKTELGRLATTLNRAFDRLQAAYDRQTRFTADASHELRTPLSIIVTNAELGLRNERTPKEYRAALQTCLRAAQRMSGVMESLLTLARSDVGELPFGSDPVDFAALTEETVEFLRPLAEERGIVLGVTTEPVELRGDPDRLREAVANLVSNAIRYNREGGRVDVTVGTRDGHAVFEVVDTGIGIPEEALPDIFERFYRVDPARSREVEGSGLGLAITKWIVTAHRGEITIESELGAGTTATFRLPLA